jgi:hypothetical protein
MADGESLSENVVEAADVINNENNAVGEGESLFDLKT